MSAALRHRAAARADTLIARRERVPLLRWLPLAALAGAVLLPGIRRRAIALSSAALLQYVNSILKSL